MKYHHPETGLQLSGSTTLQAVTSCLAEAAAPSQKWNDQRREARASLTTHSLRQSEGRGPTRDDGGERAYLAPVRHSSSAARRGAQEAQCRQRHRGRNPLPRSDSISKAPSNSSAIRLETFLVAEKAASELLSLPLYAEIIGCSSKEKVVAELGKEL